MHFTSDRDAQVFQERVGFARNVYAEIYAFLRKDSQKNYGIRIAHRNSKDKVISAMAKRPIERERMWPINNVCV